MNAEKKNVMPAPADRAIHTPENCHWYDSTGKPVFEVQDSTGKKLIAPDVRHARKLWLFPGVTAVNKTLANRALNDWGRENIVRTCIAYPRMQGETDKQYVSRMLERSNDYGNATADRGKVMHTQIGEYLAHQVQPTDEACIAAVRQIDGIFEKWGVFKVHTEVPFSNTRLGWAGCIDLLCEVRGRAFQFILPDIKTTNLANFYSPYPSWGAQLGAYKAGKGLPGNTPLVQIVVDRTTGEVKMFEWEHHDMLIKKFSHTFEIWVIDNEYDPRLGPVEQPAKGRKEK